mgnify:CR=1 FL=1
MLNGTRLVGKSCAVQHPDCVQVTCLAAERLFPQFKGLSNCTGKCCTSDLCNKDEPTVSVTTVIKDQPTTIVGVSTVTITPPMSTSKSTTPTVSSSASALSQKGNTKFLFVVFLFVGLSHGLVTSNK